jgi:hypothetical protein
MLAALVGILVGFVIGELHERRDQRAQREQRDKLIADLHSRLAARTYSEYAAFNPHEAQEGPLDSGRRLMFDDTGLIEVDDPNE